MCYAVTNHLCRQNFGALAALAGRVAPLFGASLKAGQTQKLQLAGSRAAPNPSSSSFSSAGSGRVSAEGSRAGMVKVENAKSPRHG